MSEPIYASDGVPFPDEPGGYEATEKGPDPVEAVVEKLSAEPEGSARNKATREHVYSLARSGADYETIQTHKDALIDAGLIKDRAFEAALKWARGEHGNTQPQPAVRQRSKRASVAVADVSAPGRDGEEVHRGQLRWALRFAERYRGQFMHTPGRGWFQWSGSHWEFIPRSSNKPPASVARAVLGIVRGAFMEMPDLPPFERQELLEDIRKAETNNGVIGIIGLASVQARIARADDELDNHPDLWVCPNGTYELMTDVWRPSRPEDLITKVAGCDYDPHATCPTYDAGMIRWQPDPVMRAYVHRIGGSAMQGRATEQTLPVFYGKGANGKGSTLNDSWLRVFGEYGRPMGIEVLMSSPTGDSYLPQKAALAGVRLVITSEPERGMRFNGGTLKVLTGGNTVSARALYQAPMDVRPTWQIIMECNTRPTPPADDDAVWRRLRQVGWDVVIPEGERDTALPQRLGEELPGILNRLLAGWRDYRDGGGIRMPENVRTATAEWRQEVDIHGQFLADCCHTNTGDHTSTPSSAVYARWVGWCRANGEEPGSNKAFTETLRARDTLGVRWKRSNGAKWVGLLLQREPDPDAQ